MTKAEGERRQVRQAMITGIRWLATARLVAQVSNWVITLLVIRLLTPEDYGLQAMVAAVYTLLLLLTQSGFDRAIARHTGFDDDQLRRIFGFTLAVSTTVMVSVWLLAPAIAAYYQEPRVVPILRVLSIGFPLTVFRTIPVGLVWRALDYRTHAVAGLIGTIAASVVTLSLALLGYGVWSLIAGMLSVPLASAIYLQIRTRWLVWPGFGVAAAGPLIRYAFTISISFFVWMFAWRLDILIGGQQLTAAELGFYAVAIRLCAIPLSKIVPLANEILYPAYARLQGDSDAVHVYFRKALASLCLLLFPLFFGLAAIAEWAVPLVFGSRWTGIESVMMIVAVAMPFRVVLAMCNPLLQATGNAMVAVTTGLMAIVLIAFSVLIGVRWGVIGLSLAALVATPLVMGIVVMRTRSASGLSFGALVGSVGPPLAISAMMAIIVYLAGTSLAERLSDAGIVGLQILFGIVVYVLLAAVFSRGLLLSTVSIVHTSLTSRNKRST